MTPRRRAELLDGAEVAVWLAVDLGYLVKRKGKPDIRRPHRYPCGSYVQGDALEILRRPDILRQFHYVHASPPCQGFSSLRHLSKDKDRSHLVELFQEVQGFLVASGLPYSLENVPGAPVKGWVTLLCGTMFGLVTPDGRAEIRRHRLFETSFSLSRSGLSASTEATSSRRPATATREMTRTAGAVKPSPSTERAWTPTGRGGRSGAALSRWRGPPTRS